MSQVGGGIRRVRLQGCQARGEFRQGPPPLERGAGRAEQVDDRPPSVVTAVERAQCSRGRITMRGGFGQSVLLGGEGVVLVGVLEPGRVDLGDLVPQQIGLARPGAIVAPEGLELAVQGATMRASSCEGPEIDAPEGVQRPALCRRVEQRLLGVLPVELEQPGPGFGQRRDRRHTTVDPGA